MWITGAEGADWGIVFARTGEQGDRGGITCFIVNGQPEGMSMKPIPVIRSYAPYEITFKDVEIPVEDRLGEEGPGLPGLREVAGRRAASPTPPAPSASRRRRCRSPSTGRRERETFRTKLADKQAVQWMVADSEMELRAARLLTYQAAWIGDLGRGDLKVASSIAKVTATETAGRVVDRCIQILGALGVSRELPLERWYRELRIKRIGEGPSEVHRMVLARQLLGVGALSPPREHLCRSTSTSLDGGIAVITINRPDKRNALDAEHYQALSEAWTRVRDDDAIRVAVVTGAGDKVFSAGADLKSWIGRKVQHRRDVADAAGHAAQPRAGGLEAGDRRRQRSLPGRRHDADAGHRHPRQRPSMPRSGSARSSAASSRPTAARSGCRSSCRTPSRWRCCSPATPSTRRRPRAGAWSTASCRPTRSWPTALDFARRIAANAPLAVQAAKELALRGSDLALAAGLRFEQFVNHILQRTRRRGRRPPGVRRQARAASSREMSM